MNQILKKLHKFIISYCCLYQFSYILDTSGQNKFRTKKALTVDQFFLFIVIKKNMKKMNQNLKKNIQACLKELPLDLSNIILILTTSNQFIKFIENIVNKNFLKNNFILTHLYIIIKMPNYFITNQNVCKKKNYQLLNQHYSTLVFLQHKYILNFMYQLLFNLNFTKIENIIGYIQTHDYCKQPYKIQFNQYA
eukprot:TRINITY_DN4641_c1_g1_i1.p1 TRINITY_DN4641_c1_g1~~TRINITY_DN4641_c1_g1_i1.p1  ORF type:complete len:193 (-),score=-21.02 TRINITY_DN4641_c1_g1_i1:106-684(-)